MNKRIYQLPLYLELIALLFLFSQCKKSSAEKEDRFEMLRKSVPTVFTSLVNPFGDGSTIGAACNVAYDILLLFDEAGTRYAWWQNSRIQGIFDIHDAKGIFGDLKIETVGAALHYSLSSNLSYLIFFDKSGKKFIMLNYAIADFKASDTERPDSVAHNILNVVNSISAFGGPFQDDGFEAAVLYVKPYAGKDAWHIFQKGTDKYARWANDRINWGPVLNFADWGGNNSLFPTVGAAAYWVKHDVAYNLFISRDGTQLGVWHMEGTTSVFDGPWKIN